MENKKVRKLETCALCLHSCPVDKLVMSVMNKEEVAICSDCHNELAMKMLSKFGVISRGRT